jgi:hypothetical protein
MLACSLVGHRPRFRAQGSLLSWECERGCGARGEKAYPTAELAQRYAQAFDREDRADLGRRPLLSLMALKLLVRARRRE